MKRGKRVWRSRPQSMVVQRVGKDPAAPPLYSLQWRGGWGTLEAKELSAMIKLLQQVQADLKERMSM